MHAVWLTGMPFHPVWSLAHFIVQQDTQLLFLPCDNNRKNFNDACLLTHCSEACYFSVPVRSPFSLFSHGGSHMLTSWTVCIHIWFYKMKVKIGDVCFLEWRFSCAAVSKDSNAFQFHGTPRVWDGKTIKRLITGNSVLYIVMEGDQVCLKYPHLKD